MKLIVGLGNPKEKYQNNRRNVGLMIVDYLVNELTGSRANEFKKEKMSHITCYILNDIVIAKPQTFMNHSGIAVKSCITSYKLQEI
ncbi:MAG: hypothetical protein QHH09_02685 [Microgenomates group bacterium]|nr:hypothetical protein [Microgenomates group bacterium]